MQSPHRAVVAPRNLPLQEPSFCTEKSGKGGRGSQHKIAQNHGPLELARGTGLGDGVIQLNLLAL